MSQMTINVEFLAGTEIKQAVVEAKEKAALWKVSFVCFRFNGVNFSIGATADIEEVLEEWKSHDNKSYGICSH